MRAYVLKVTPNGNKFRQNSGKNHCKQDKYNAGIKKNIEFLVISNFIMLPITNYKNLSFVINDNTSNVYLFDME